jgi:DNA-binding response OmpR family regulator
VRILVADDEPVSRRILQSMLEDWGYSVRVCTDGAVAWELLQCADAPPLVILDWVMPRMNGLEVCRKLRSVSALCPTYVLLVTAKDQNADLVTGLHAGADDYITKPFNREELRARVQVGERVVELQRRLAERVRELEEASPTSSISAGCCRFAPIAKRSAMTRITGNKSSATSPNIPRHSLAMAFVRTAMRRWSKRNYPTSASMSRNLLLGGVHGHGIRPAAVEC